MIHLVTGYAGKEHITSADQGSFNAAVMGAGEFVLEGGEQFRCQVISNNKVRIYDGEALMQGRHIKVERNTYEETTHDNGTQGYQRIDLVVLTYTKDATTGIENVTLDVIKGTPAASNPEVPEYVKGDILNLGDLKNQMPLYKIPFDGLSIGEPVAMFKTISTLETMKAEVDAEVEAKKAELDAKFAEMEGSIDDKIAEAGKPLSSNADDWALIKNYGEYSTDAKTAGEEFKKINDSLTNENAETFNFGYLNGVRGFFTNPSRADDSFIPFKGMPTIITATGNGAREQFIDCSSIANYNSLTVDNFAFITCSLSVTAGFEVVAKMTNYNQDTGILTIDTMSNYGTWTSGSTIKIVCF